MKSFPLSKSNNTRGVLEKYRPALTLLILYVLLGSGCSSFGVQPWERDLLAKPEMALSGDAMDSALDDHIYFSKEGTSGGRGFAGGGCGCN